MDDASAREGNKEAMMTERADGRKEALVKGGGGEGGATRGISYRTRGKAWRSNGWQIVGCIHHAGRPFPRRTDSLTGTLRWILESRRPGQEVVQESRLRISITVRAAHCTGSSQGGGEETSHGSRLGGVAQG